MAQGMSEAEMIMRIRRLEENVRRLADAKGVDIDDPRKSASDAVMALVQKGDRMAAAAQYAKETGASFVDAQVAVNML